MNTHPFARSRDMGSEPPESGADDALWASFAAPPDRARFLAAWLGIAARRIEGATLAILLLQTEDGGFAPAAFFPARSDRHKALLGVAQTALGKREGATERAPEGVVRLAYPVEAGGQVNGVIAVEAQAGAAARLRHISREIHWASGWLERFAWEEQARLTGRSHERVLKALEIAAVAGEHSRLGESALAVANECASLFAADRVSVGLFRRGRIRVVAMSQSAWYERRTELVRAIETAMEESFHQRATTQFPKPDDGTAVIAAHRQLSARWDSPVILSVLLEAEGRAVGVMTLERTAETAFDAETREDIELAASAAGPLLSARSQQERFVSGRGPHLLGVGIKAIFGRRRPALKLAAVGALAAILAVTLIPTTLRITANAVVEGSIQRAVVAPFEGFIRTAPARAGDMVDEGQLLATLEDRDLRFESGKLESERQKLAQRQRDAMARGERVNIQVIGSQLAQVETDMRLNEQKLARTRIVAPVGGLVVSGDLSQTLGTPIEAGKVLFEIVPRGDFRLVLQVDDVDLPLIATGQTGAVVLSALPGRPIPITLTRITPIVSNAEQRNTFRVEASFPPPEGLALRPGMEGVAKIEAEEASILWTWARRTVARVRLFFWNWLP